jgi:hypothetical protein
LEPEIISANSERLASRARSAKIFLVFVILVLLSVDALWSNITHVDVMWSNFFKTLLIAAIPLGVSILYATRRPDVCMSATFFALAYLIMLARLIRQRC